MKALNFKVAHPVRSWDEDAFARSVPTPVGFMNGSNNDGIIDAVINVAKNTKDMIVGESKTIAPDMVETFRDSKRRLNSGNRIINAIPNSYLYYGVVTYLGYLVVTKLL